MFFVVVGYSCQVFPHGLREIVKEFIIVACRLNGRRDADEYLSALTDRDKENYEVFRTFALRCNDTLLGIMDQLGYSEHDQKLIKVIREILEWRRYYHHGNGQERSHSRFLPTKWARKK